MNNEERDFTWRWHVAINDYNTNNKPRQSWLYDAKNHLVNSSGCRYFSKWNVRASYQPYITSARTTLWANRLLIITYPACSALSVASVRSYWRWIP